MLHQQNPEWPGRCPCKSYVHILTPGTYDANGFGKRVFAGVIKSLETRSSWITRGALNPKPSALEATEETQTGQRALEDAGGERSSSATSQGASRAQELAEAFPQGLQREHGPAGTWILDRWPPEP